MISPYVAQPTRTRREVEIDQLCANLKHDHRFDKTDGYISSVRRLIEYALVCAKQHHDNLPIFGHVTEPAEALVDLLDETMLDYLVPAEESFKEYLEGEGVE